MPAGARAAQEDHRAGAEGGQVGGAGESAGVDDEAGLPLAAVAARLAVVIPLRVSTMPSVDESEVVVRVKPAFLLAVMVPVPAGAVSVPAPVHPLTLKEFAVPLAATTRLIGPLNWMEAPLKASVDAKVTAALVTVKASVLKPVPDWPSNGRGPAAAGKEDRALGGDGSSQLSAQGDAQRAGGGIGGHQVRVSGLDRKAEGIGNGQTEALGIAQPGAVIDQSDGRRRVGAAGTVAVAPPVVGRVDRIGCLNVLDADRIAREVDVVNRHGARVAGVGPHQDGRAVVGERAVGNGGGGFVVNLDGRGRAGDGALADRQFPSGDVQAAAGMGGVGAEGAVGQRGRAVVVRATAAASGGIARDGVVGQAQCVRATVGDAAAIDCRVPRNRAADDRQAVDVAVTRVVVDDRTAGAGARRILGKRGVAHDDGAPLVADGTAIRRGVPRERIVRHGHGAPGPVIKGAALGQGGVARERVAGERQGSRLGDWPPRRECRRHRHTTRSSP